MKGGQRESDAISHAKCAMSMSMLLSVSVFLYTCLLVERKQASGR